MKLTELGRYCPAPTDLARSVARALLGAGAGLTAPQPAVAQLGEPAHSPTAATKRLEEIIVMEGQRERYRVDDSALPKLTETLRDTPQSITTLSRALLDDRGLITLNDALRNVPGITLGAGEFSWQGTNLSIRGFNSRDDMYLDGIRDFGSYPRDPFNLETIEVLMGPSSVLFGRGSTGGAVNQVTKQPTRDELTNLSVNIGDDDTLRGTLDFSRPVPLLGDGGAFRLNVLAHSGEVADRDVARTERFGLAPSLAFDLGAATRLTLSYVKQTSDDTPDYGLPWLDGKPAPVPRHNFYGFTSDHLETDADIGTAQLTHESGDTVSLDSQVRYARYSRASRITEPLITQAPDPGASLDDVSVYRYVFLGESDETLLTAQTNVRLDLRSGAVEHALVTGVEISRETSKPVFAFGIGAPSTALLTPTSDDAFTATTTAPRVIADTTGETLALYALDTLKLSDSWQLTLGARWDRFDTDYDADRFAGPPTPFNAGSLSGHESIDRVERVVSYRAAFVYKPALDIISVYVAGSTSFNPSAQSLSQLTSGRGLGVGNAHLDPEENRSIEAGFKADLKEGALALTGALFEITKTNARVADPSNPGFNTLGGEHRVRGWSLDVSGTLTDKLYLSAGYTYFDSEVVRAAPGAATGRALTNAPEHSASVWMNHRISDRFDLGFGARYVSDQLADNAGTGKSVPSYSLLDAMGRYRVSDWVTVKLNLTNLTDELYFDQLHPWHVVPGPGFTSTLAVNVFL